MCTINLVRFSSTKKQARYLADLEERFFSSLTKDISKKAHKKLSDEYFEKCEQQEPQPTWSDYFLSVEYDD